MFGMKGFGAASFGDGEAKFIAPSSALPPIIDLRSSKDFETNNKKNIADGKDKS